MRQREVTNDLIFSHVSTLTLHVMSGPTTDALRTDVHATFAPRRYLPSFPSRKLRVHVFLDPDPRKAKLPDKNKTLRPEPDMEETAAL